MGIKMDVSHFNIFGAFIHYHVSEESRKNFEPTTKLGVFLGYTETPHNYCAYFPSLRIIVVGRDVNFDEEKVMGRFLKREIQLQLDQEILAPKEEPREVVEKPQVEE